MQRRIAVLVLFGSALLASAASAFDPLWKRLPPDEHVSAWFAGKEARAKVQDGLLVGYGHERVEAIPGGRLRVVRTRVYRHVRHPESRKLHALPEPWQVRSSVTLSSALRLLSSDTTLQFHRSVDRALGYPFSERFESLFEWDRARVVADRTGQKLTRTAWRARVQVERETYAYPTGAVPLEIVGMVLARAVRHRVARFDFDLLLPDGSIHGVRSQVHWTRDPSRFARDYPVPRGQLPSGSPLAVVEMWLASPFKRVFFPHRFYMVYAERDPSQPLALWGGDPDEHLQAFRE